MALLQPGILITLSCVFTHPVNVHNEYDHGMNGEEWVDENAQNLGDHIGHDDIMFRKFEEEILFGSLGEEVPLADAIRNINKHWELPIPYVFDESISKQAQKLIEGGFEEYKKKTCIEFRKKEEKDKDYLMFISSVGCWSYVGKSGGKQYISLSNRCLSLQTICHEIMHALGFFHEQSRPDRDNYVNINFKNIDSKRHKNFAKQHNHTVTTLDHPYDYHSTMHYKSHYFSINGKKTIERKDNKTEEFGIKNPNERGLSTIDAKQLNALYCSKKPTTKSVKTTPSKVATTNRQTVKRLTTASINMETTSYSTSTDGSTTTPGITSTNGVISTEGTTSTDSIADEWSYTTDTPTYEDEQREPYENAPYEEYNNIEEIRRLMKAIKKVVGQ